MMENNIVNVKAKAFAVRIIHLYKYLNENQKEYVMSRQILRSGTSIGANLSECIYAQSALDFISKSQIALKEASETQYWLELLQATDYLSLKEFEILNNDQTEIIKLLVSRINTTKTN